ncbi:hypothetical protein RRG08_027098 [Elysia crispata]|uniref:Uncharacterized protein n=1 Tax=Elysia crispata TaxID=231223 RepID=A0AAE0YT09_9GAST|nr:hypothetical protein RRG08_027098 [Elysia crispata]
MEAPKFGLKVPGFELYILPDDEGVLMSSGETLASRNLHEPLSLIALNSNDIAPKQLSDFLGSGTQRSRGQVSRTWSSVSAQDYFFWY